MMSGDTQIAAGRAFEQSIGSGAWVVLFSAPWCLPGDRVADRLAALPAALPAARMAVDIDHLPGIARRYQVTAVPSVLLFQEGRLIGRRLGELDAQDLEDWVTDHLGA